jgi:hypothetical protein
MTEEQTEQLAGELPELSPKWDAFVNNFFLRKCNQTDAYLDTYPSVKKRSTARRLASRLMTNEDIKAHIAARFKEMQMGTDEALVVLTEQARGNIGVFFKPVDEWMFFPLATHEILDMKEVEDESTNPPKKRIMYRVRHLVLDIDKVMDPQYAHLIKEFQDKGKDGMSIKLHDPQGAIDKVLRVSGAYKDKVDLTSGGEKLAPVTLNVVYVDKKPPSDDDSDAKL